MSSCIRTTNIRKKCGRPACGGRFLTKRVLGVTKRAFGVTNKKNLF